MLNVPSKWKIFLKISQFVPLCSTILCGVDHRYDSFHIDDMSVVPSFSLSILGEPEKIHSSMFFQWLMSTSSFVRTSNFSGLNWIGLDWIGLDWIGLDWIEIELNWIELNWIELNWIGLDWIGLDWMIQFGSVRFGSVRFHLLFFVHNRRRYQRKDHSCYQNTSYRRSNSVRQVCVAV